MLIFFFFVYHCLFRMALLDFSKVVSHNVYFCFVCESCLHKNKFELHTKWIWITTKTQSPRGQLLTQLSKTVLQNVEFSLVCQSCFHKN